MSKICQDLFITSVYKDEEIKNDEVLAHMGEAMYSYRTLDDEI
jgi:hypothetical protein